MSYRINGEHGMCGDFCGTFRGKLKRKKIKGYINQRLMFGFCNFNKMQISESNPNFEQISWIQINIIYVLLTFRKSALKSS